MNVLFLFEAAPSEADHPGFVQRRRAMILYSSSRAKREVYAD